jgi:hypothetical protein
MSSSGQYQLSAAYGSYIWVSSDYGNTWNYKSTKMNWQYSTMSSSGQYQTAVEDTNVNNTGYIWVSSDYGNTWNQKASLLDWYMVACSNSGQYQTALEDTDLLSNGLWVSNDYGNTWTLKESQSWNSITMSGSGQYQIAPVYGSNISYISTDYGNTWVSTVQNYWDAVFFSTTGQTQVALCTSVDFTVEAVQVSYDFGNTWSTQNLLCPPLSCALSPDGNFITIAGTYIYVHASTNTIPWIYKNGQWNIVTHSFKRIGGQWVSAKNCQELISGAWQ